MGPQNGLLGDNFGTDIPEMRMDNQDLVNEKKRARFSKTKEYLALKEHLQSRIAFYQTQLPDGRAIPGLPKDELLINWAVANLVIREFDAIITAYETVRDTVK